MDWNRWIERFKQGRVFVTNAPLLTFTVNGQPLGSVIRIPVGTSYKAKLTTDVNADIPLSSVELIQNGKVIENYQLQTATQTAHLDKEVLVDRSCWFAVRVTGQPTRGGPGLSRAHSGAIYVDVGGQPALIREDLELMVRMLDRLWAYLEERNNFGPRDNRRRARELFDRARREYLNRMSRAQ
jgi:hypothetical protein